MGEQIVKSYNLFLNSDDATNDGMRYDFQLGNNSIVCGAGQYLRLSLNNYSQYVTWSNVNSYNNVAYLRTTIGGAGVEYFPVTITPGNYASIADLALDLGTKVATALGTLPFPWGAASLSIPSVSPPAGVGVGGTTDNRISFEVTFATGWTTAPDTTNGDLALQCLYDSESLTDATLVTNPLTGILADQAHAAQGGDVGLLLGGDRLI